MRPSALLVLLFAVAPFAYGASATYPNEPAGYVPFAESPMDAWPAVVGNQVSGNTPPGWTGKWWEAQNPGGNCYLSTDATAPQSPPSVYVTRFPAGYVAGTGPCFIGGWDAAGPSGTGYKNAFYFSFWLKINNAIDQPYENHGVLTKMGWVAYGNVASVSTNPGFFGLALNSQSSTPVITDKFKINFNQQGFVDRSLGATTGGLLHGVGVWHHWEVLFIVNNPANNYNCPDQYGNPHDCGDGVFRMWVDGVKVNDHTDMAFKETGFMNPFYSYIWNPTWGGTNQVKTQTDYMYIDHIYMSEPGTGTAQCGNGAIESGEQCEGSNLNGATCISRGFTGGTLSCSASCQYVTSACTGSGDTTPPVATITAPTNNQALPSGTTTTPVAVTTNEPATCRRSATDMPYSSMPAGNALVGGGTTSHSGTFSTFTDGGTYTRYVRCIDVAGNEMAASSAVTFSVATSGPKPGDLNNDGKVDLVDVQRVLTVFGQSGVTTGEDVNGDNTVSLYDLIILARNWG